MKALAIRRIFVTVCFAVTSLLPAGCREGAKPPAAPLKWITIACAALPLSALLAVAWKNGHFAEEGLEDVPQTHSFGNLALDAALLVGKADFANSGDTPATLLNHVRLALKCKLAGRSLALAHGHAGDFALERSERPPGC